MRYSGTRPHSRGSFSARLAMRWRTAKFVNRRQVGIELLGFRRRAATASCLHHLENAHIPMNRRRDHIARPYRVTGLLSTDLVNPYSPALNESCRQRPRLRNPSIPQPLVEPLRFLSSISASSGLRRSVAVGQRSSLVVWS
jgi:hypothetical protein